MQLARSLGMRLNHSFLITFYTWVYTCTCTHKHYLLIGCCKLSINNSTNNLPTQQQREYILSWRKCSPHPSTAGQIHWQLLQRNGQYCKEQENDRSALAVWSLKFEMSYWFCLPCSQPLLSFLSLGESLWTKLSFCYKAHFEAYAHSTSPFHCCRPFNMLTRSCIIWRKGDQWLKSLSYA